MNVLVACERSGKVREAFRKRGHNAYSCDIVPADDESPYHIQGDALAILDQGWDLIIAHPPCTYLCNSGVRWLEQGRNAERMELMRQGAEFFAAFLRPSYDAPRVAVENPIMHRYAVEIIGRRQDQVIQPWQFGHGETKATCLWIRNLPPLTPTDIVEGRTGRIHRLPPSADRARLRSETYQGIADAMAEQWGQL